NLGPNQVCAQTYARQAKLWPLAPARKQDWTAVDVSADRTAVPSGDAQKYVAWQATCVYAWTAGSSSK
ncbi:MAG TPA: hypothetical protein VIL63_06590, partial [Terriglobales bacterium]